MSATIHYWARLAAEGGPGFSGPTIDPDTLTDGVSGTIAVVYDDNDADWKVTDSQGNVYASSENPGDLASWMAEYVSTLGAMHERGEL
jgi:hypothetical protein